MFIDYSFDSFLTILHEITTHNKERKPSTISRTQVSESISPKAKERENPLRKKPLAY